MKGYRGVYRKHGGHRVYVRGQSWVHGAVDIGMSGHRGGVEGMQKSSWRGAAGCMEEHQLVFGRG